MEVGLLNNPLLTACILGITSLLFLYWYLTKNFGYWKKRGIPYVKPIPFFGSTFDVLRKPFHEVEHERYMKFGLLYGHFEGRQPILSVGDTKLIRDILVKEFPTFINRRNLQTGNAISDAMLPLLHGEDWKRVRCIVSPTFTTGKIKRMVSIVKECSQTLVKNFERVAVNEIPPDVRKLYGAFSMDVIASTAFSTKLDSLNDPQNVFVQMAEKAFSSSFNVRLILYQLFPRLMKFLGVSVFIVEPLNFFKDLTLQILQERERTGQTRNDFLQLLIDTAKEVAKEQKWEIESDKEDITSNYGQDESTHQTIKNVSKRDLSLNELVGTSVIFFFAGSEPTRTTLSYASYQLALNPHVQGKLYAELRQVLENRKDELSYEALQELKYLDNVISETLRLYPPSARLERVAEADFKLGDTGLTIPKGMIVAISNYPLHMDPKFFPDPEKFDPDRFTPEERARRDQYAYMPFGAGPRNCIGMRFALMMIKVCLVYIIANFEIHRCPETKVPLEFDKSQVLMSAKSVILKLEPRKEKIQLR